MRKWLLLLSCTTGILAQTGGPARIKIVPGKPIPAKPPEPQPGDKVIIDPATGDLIAESGGMRRRIVRRTQVQPEFSVTWVRQGPGVHYTYTLSNGVGARQRVQLFTLEVSDAPVTITASPPYWRNYGSFLKVAGGLQRVQWARHARDDDPALQLLPGLSAGPFSLESTALPGLVKGRVMGFKPFPKPGEESDESHDRFALVQSEWVTNAINEALSFENNTVLRYTIGPKIDPRADIVQSVQKELLEAARLPEFAEMRADLERSAAWSDRTAIREAVRNLGQTLLQKAFVNAMIFDLDYQQ